MLFAAKRVSSKQATDDAPWEPREHNSDLERQKRGCSYRKGKQGTRHPGGRTDDLDLLKTILKRISVILYHVKQQL